MFVYTIYVGDSTSATSATSRNLSAPIVDVYRASCGAASVVSILSLASSALMENVEDILCVYGQIQLRGVIVTASPQYHSDSEKQR